MVIGLPCSSSIAGCVLQTPELTSLSVKWVSPSKRRDATCCSFSFEMNVTRRCCSTASQPSEYPVVVFPRPDSPIQTVHHPARCPPPSPALPSVILLKNFSLLLKRMGGTIGPRWADGRGSYALA